MWIENRKSYRIRQVICAILGTCASLVLTFAVMDRQEVLAAKQVVCAQEKLADKVFRFHVLANSDSEADQELKLKVRDAILSYMKEYIGIDKGLVSCKSMEQSVESPTEIMLDCQTVRTWAAGHLTEIEETALQIIHEEGYNYLVTARVVECYFPDRRYGNVLFPKGYYEALRVEIGAAAGHNWWCVLYPSLCFTDATCAVVTEEGEEELEKVLDKETYEAVTINSTFKIKSYFLELFRERTKD